MFVSEKNLYHLHRLQKLAHNKNIKPKSYAFGDKVLLNSKYIKTKQNWKLEAMFFNPFWVLRLVEKQAYMLKLLMVENLQYFLYVIARAGYHKEEISRQSNV